MNETATPAQVRAIVRAVLAPPARSAQQQGALARTTPQRRVHRAKGAR